MTTKREKKARLSGWTRLWMVLTLLSWLAGGADLALSTQPLKWPFPLGEASPQSVRHLLWFLGPILLASAWGTIRWIWRGFHPLPSEAAIPQMGTAEIVRRAFGLLEKIGMTVFLLAWIGMWIFAWSVLDPKPFWLDVFVPISTYWKLSILTAVWADS